MSRSLNWKEPELDASKASFLSRFAFYVCLALLGLISASACFYSVFRPSLSVGVVLATVLITVAGTCALLLCRRGGLFLLGALVVLGLALCALYFSGRDGHGIFSVVLQGAIQLINSVLETYNARTEFYFGFIPTPVMSASAARLAMTWSASIILALVSLVLTWSIQRCRSALLCVALTVGFLVPGLLYNIYPPVLPLFALGLFWLFLLVYLPLPRRQSRFRVRKADRVFAGHGLADVRASALALLLPLALLMLSVAFFFPKANFSRNPTLENLRVATINGQLLRAFFQGGGLLSTTNAGDLRSAGNRNFDGRTMLRVITSNENPDYLKGFVGSVYTGTSWEQLSRAQQTELDALTRDFAVQNYPALKRQLELDNSEFFTEWSSDEYSLSVENVGANPRTVFAPYGLATTPDDLAKLEFVSGAYLRSRDRIVGLTNYRLFSFPLLPSELLFDKPGSVPEFPAFPEVRALTEAIARYGDFAHATYTQLPENLKANLDGYRQRKGLTRENYPANKDFILACIKALHDENEYTLSPGATPQDQDFVDYFLNTNHQGYCVHFASALTTLLRSANIPARYATGFTVSPHDKKNNKGWIILPDSRAHAWTEVFIDNYGWVPVEATPGNASGLSAVRAIEAGALVFQTEAGTTTNTGDTETGESVQNEGSPRQQQTPRPDTGGRQNASTTATDTKETTSTAAANKQAIRVAGIALGILALMGALLIVIRRFTHLAIRKKRIQQPDRNAAAIAAYDYVLRLQAFVHPHKSEDDYSIPNTIRALAYKARYSQHDLRESEKNLVLDYAFGLAKQTRDYLPFWDRLVGAFWYTLF